MKTILVLCFAMMASAPAFGAVGAFQVGSSLSLDLSDAGMVEGELSEVEHYGVEEIDLLLEHLGIADQVAEDFYNQSEPQEMLHKAGWGNPWYRRPQRFKGVTCVYTDGWFNYPGNGFNGIQADLDARGRCRSLSRYWANCRPVAYNYCFYNWGY